MSSESTNTLSLYFHIPFCQLRCAYCDFNTYTGLAHLIPAYTEALQHEIAHVASTIPSDVEINTIYFGGGTPSLLPVAAVAAILNCCASTFTLQPDIEITLEANPGTVDADQLTGLRQCGINRLSIGMQSAHAEELALFARDHGQKDVRDTVRAARNAGFGAISLDLIYGIPRQTQTMWQHSLDMALNLKPDHVSLYSLSVEEMTPLHRQIARGDLPAPDPDQAAEMYEWAAGHLVTVGFEQYEISNWARPGFACRHNLHIWRNRPYLGFGAGAHGCAARTRYANVRHPAAYIERIRSQHRTQTPFPLSAAAEEVEHLDENTIMAETMILGLRLTQNGISARDFRARFQRDLWEVYGVELDRLIDHGLLEETAENGVILTPRGRLLGNHVFAAFV